MSSSSSMTIVKLKTLDWLNEIQSDRETDDRQIQRERERWRWRKERKIFRKRETERRQKGRQRDKSTGRQID